MYEARYALRTRPFSPVPGEGYVRFPSLAIPRRQAENCLRDGSGMLLVTGDVGVGKSVFCAEVAAGLGPEWQSTFVSGAGTGQVDDVYESLLHQWDCDAAPQSRAAARHRILEAARRRSGQGHVLLVVDDAQDLSSDSLNELRALLAATPVGLPPLRLILCGRPALEEQLAVPELSDLQQRIGCHVILEELTLAESREYVRARIAHAGGTLETVFTSEAVDAICEISAGRPRCLNQLCEHCLLLGYADDEQPIACDTVYRAVDDLKGLALPWNLPYRSPRAADDALHFRGAVEPAVPPDSTLYETTAASAAAGLPSRSDAAGNNWWEDQEHVAVIEVGGENEMSVSNDPVGLTPPSHIEDDALTELHISDRYAELDRRLEGSRRFEPAICLPPRAPEPRSPESVAAAPAAEDTVVEERLIDTVIQLCDEMQSVISTEDSELFGSGEAWDVVMPETDGTSSHRASTVSAPENAATRAASEAEPALRIRAAMPEEEPAAVPREAADVPRPRRYAQLFSRLRWRRAVTADDVSLGDGLR